MGLLCFLKSFPILGRFAHLSEVPVAVVEYLAKRADLQGLTLADYPLRTRAHLSDLINGAIEALIADHFALPALSALRRLAGAVHARATSLWLTGITARMPESASEQLDALLLVASGETESAFAKLFRPTRRASKDHLDQRLEHVGWLNTLSLPERMLADLPPNRIDAWAEEARRLTATELREYAAPRRHALLACLLVRTRASRLDDLVSFYFIDETFHPSQDKVGQKLREIVPTHISGLKCAHREPSLRELVRISPVTWRPKPKLSTGNRPIWHVSVNTLKMRGMPHSRSNSGPNG